jgi:hypothetical protein
MDNRTVAGCMDFNLLVGSFDSPHSLLRVSSQLSDHTTATSANRYVTLQEYYFSVCEFCFLFKWTSKDVWKRNARTFLYQPIFVDTNVISPTGVGRALEPGLKFKLSLGLFHCCSSWLNTLQKYLYQWISVILATIHLI